MADLQMESFCDESPYIRVRQRIRQYPKLQVDHRIDGTVVHDEHTRTPVVECIANAFVDITVRTKGFEVLTISLWLTRNICIVNNRIAKRLMTNRNVRVCRQF